MPETQRAGRVLALDFGKRRIGLAISDELGLTAQGLETLERTNIRQDLGRLGTIIAERGVSMIVMGDPLHLSGQPGAQSALAREFAARLGKRTGLPVTLWDERLTSVEANRVLRESGSSLQKRKRAVDRLAAVILLESYLEWQSLSRKG